VRHALAADAVDTYVQAEMAKQHIPGLALLVSRDGQSSAPKATPVQCRTASPGQAGDDLSIRLGGKQFTATAVMMLVEEGKIGLDDPLTKYFPDAPASWKQITVRELLSHTSGFTDYPKSFDMRKDYTKRRKSKWSRPRQRLSLPGPVGATAISAF